MADDVSNDEWMSDRKTSHEKVENYVAQAPMATKTLANKIATLIETY
jgi:hypothetical protein